VQNGDGGEFFHFIKPAGAKDWKRITRYSDRVVQMDLTPDGGLVAISRLGAKRGKLFLIRGPDFDIAAARVIVPEAGDNIINDHYGTRTVLPVKDRIYVRYQTGGPSEIRVFDYSGSRLPGPRQVQAGAVYTMIPVGEGDVLYPTASYLTPMKMYRFEAATAKTHETALGIRADVDWSEIEAVREFATSKDGTRVPVTILRRKGIQLDGSHPTVATGYGGYGISVVPAQNTALKALLERGVVYAISNLRGGGEFGEDWHEQGRLTRKQNVFDDFEAVLRHLIRRGYTRPDRLGISGGSNGGLLVGALITQHPDLVRAAVIKVGVLDMLRSELSPNGAFNTVEYGTVKEKQHFDVLYAYSPYHRVRDNTNYPSVLLTTGLNDNRVDPMHSLKMAARLQAASTSGRPVLLTVDGESGHGGGTRRSAAMDNIADEFTFLLHELGAEGQGDKAQPSGHR
jgi:prolyl oligopeptidase